MTGRPETSRAASAPSSSRVRGWALVVAAAAVAAVLSLLLLVVPTSTSVSETQGVRAGDSDPAVEYEDRRVTRQTLAQSQGWGAVAAVAGPLLALTVLPLAAPRRRPAAVATRAVSTLLLLAGVLLGALSFGILYFVPAVLMLLAAVLAAESPHPLASREPALTASDDDKRAAVDEPGDRTATVAAAQSLVRRHRLVTGGAVVLAGRELAAAAAAAGRIEAEAPVVQWWLSVPLWAVGTATLMVWSWRAAANVRLLTGDARYPPALVAISWVVPLANLVVPFLAVREAARISDAPPVRGLGLWWALMVAWRLGSWAVPTLWVVPPPWVTGAVGVVAAAATVFALGAVTRRQQRMLADVSR